MAEQKRDAHDTKDRSLAKFKAEWEKSNRQAIPPAEMQKFEKKLVNEILPKIYDKR